MRSSALYSVVFNSEILTSGDGMVAVKKRMSTTSAVVSSKAGPRDFGALCGENEQSSCGGKIEEDASSLGNSAGAACSTGTKTP